MEDTDKLSTTDARVHSSFGSQRSGSRDPVRVESRLPRPTLPHRPEVSEMMDIEPDDGECRIICSGRPSREATEGDDEPINVPGFRRSPRDFKPGTQLVSGDPPDTPTTGQASPPELTSLPVGVTAARFEGQLSGASPTVGTQCGAMFPTEGVHRNGDQTHITIGAPLKDQADDSFVPIGARTAGLEVGMLPGSQRSSVEDVAEVRRWSAVEAAEVLATCRLL